MSNNKIEIPNRDKKVLKKYDKLLENPLNLEKLLNTLYEQTNYALSCYYIGARLYEKLSRKYSTLENKWYIFALNSIDDNMILLLIKLYNDEKIYHLFSSVEYLRDNFSYNRAPI